jgi:hypothetical protein
LRQLRIQFAHGDSDKQSLSSKPKKTAVMPVSNSTTYRYMPENTYISATVPILPSWIPEGEITATWSLTRNIGSGDSCGISAENKSLEVANALVLSERLGLTNCRKPGVG